MVVATPAPQEAKEIDDCPGAVNIYGWNNEKVLSTSSLVFKSNSNIHQ